MGQERLVYVPPMMEVVMMEMEGVIAGSSLDADNGGGGTPRRSSRSGGYAGRASTSELEDMISDILTVEN